jgi:hypothetical protein
MPGHLLRFKESEIVITIDETRTVLSFFFSDVPKLPNDEDRGFAQALLVEALDATYKVGFLEDLVRSLLKLPQGGVAVLKSFAKKAAVRWFKYASMKDIMEDPKIYEFVKTNIVRNFRSVWAIRMAGGGLTY